MLFRSVLAGVSAGAACWFEAALVRGASGRLERIDGLGFLKGSACAHYSTDPERRTAYPDHVARGAVPPGIGIDDGVGVLFHGSNECATWSAEDGCWAYRVRRDLRGGAVSSRLPALVKG